MWTLKPSTSSVAPAALPIPTVSIADAPVAGRLDRAGRVRVDGVLAVGEQHDDRRARGRRSGPASAAGVGAGEPVRVVVGRRADAPRASIAVSDVLDPLRERRPALRLEPLDRGHDRPRSSVGTWVEKPGVAERDDPDPDASSAAFCDELERRGPWPPPSGWARRRSRPCCPRRRTRGGPCPQPRHADHALRPGEREDEDGHAGDRAGRREPAEPRPRRLAGTAPAGPDRAAAAPRRRPEPHPNAAARAARRASRRR